MRNGLGMTLRKLEILCDLHRVNVNVSCIKWTLSEHRYDMVQENIAYLLFTIFCYTIMLRKPIKYWQRSQNSRSSRRSLMFIWIECLYVSVSLSLCMYDWYTERFICLSVEWKCAFVCVCNKDFFHSENLNSSYMCNYYLV